MSRLSRTFIDARLSFIIKRNAARRLTHFFSNEVHIQLAEFETPAVNFSELMRRFWELCEITKHWTSQNNFCAYWDLQNTSTSSLSGL